MNGATEVIASLGDYQNLRAVGRGGMGVVYEAWDTRLQRRVAVKMLHPHRAADAAFVQRFLLEARNAARIEHPNVARIYRVDTFGEHLIIEMQYIEGVPLNVLLRPGPLALEQGVEVMRQVLDALKTCHEHGVIHCDLKPGNLLVTRRGQVYLTDFGIARALENTEGSLAGDAAGGPHWGTPRYCPPEAWTGAPATAAWDLYAVGVLIYEALAGTPPYQAQTVEALLHEKKTCCALPLHALRFEVSKEFSRLIASLMTPEASQRPASVRETQERFLATPEFRLHPQDTLQLGSSARPGALPAEEEAGARLPSRGDGAQLTEHTAGRPVWTNRRWLFVGIVLLTALLAIVMPDGLRKVEAPPRPVASIENGLYSRPDGLLLTDTTLFFSAEDAVHGRELWCKTTGEREGLVADIVPGPVSGDPRNFTRRGRDDFVFVAATPETGDELWHATNPGGGSWSVRMVKDILPGPMGSDPLVIAVHENLVFFYATTLDAGRELWCSNLYAPQTAMIADMMPGKESSMPMKPNVYKSNQGLYVIAFTDMDRGLMLWRYDFASHAISPVGDVAEGAGPLAAVGTRMLFSNADDAHGYEPWFFDGATGVFQLLADLYPGPQPSDPGEAFSWGDRVLFRARTPELGLELWTTDGTPGGTQLLADLNPGPADSAPFGYVVAGQRLYFRAQDQAHGREVWSTDGTPGGTHLVADLWPGEESSDPYNLAPHADRLFFSAKDEAHGEELWVAQPAGNGWQVTLVADILPGPGSSEPHSLIWGPSQGHFLAYSRSEVAEVYRLSSDAPDDPAATWSVARLAGL